MPPIAIPAAIAGAGALAGGISSAIAAGKQESAAKAGQQLTADQIQQAGTSAIIGAQEAQANLNSAEPAWMQNIDTSHQQTTDYLTQGLGAGRQDLLDSGSLGANAVTGAQTGALSDLYGGAGQGVGYLNNAQGGVNAALNSGLGNAATALGGRSQNAQQMLDQAGGLYGNYQQSPGYKFALEQGEQGINRAQAAAGGRYSGATLKAISQFDTGLANQDYQNYVGNQNSLYQNSLGADANSLNANSQLAGLYGSAGSQSASAAQGLGGQAASMAYGSGQGAAGIEQNAGNNLADIYGRTGTQIAGNDVSAGNALAGNEANYYGSRNSLDQSVVNQLNNYGINAANMPASMIGAQATNNQAATPYAGQSFNAAGNAANNLATLGALYGSGAFGGGTPPPPPTEYKL